MAEGIEFAGKGSDADISGSMPKALPTGSLTPGGPIEGPPETNKGASTGNSIPTNSAGAVPAGSGIQFAGDV